MVTTADPTAYLACDTELTLTQPPFPFVTNSSAALFTLATHQQSFNDVSTQLLHIARRSDH